MAKMETFKRALDYMEEELRKYHGTRTFHSTSNPDILCSALPPHWRSNKSLPQQFIVLIFYPIVDGTKVSVTAGNEETPLADIKNNITEIQGQIARFSDLRIVGKSGRGKNFNITITIHAKSMKEITIVPNIIKVTVDGPRDSRNPNNKMMDVRKRPGDPLSYPPSFLPFKQQRLMPPFPLLPPSIAPGHLQAALSHGQTAPPLQSPLSQLFSLPALCESYKAVMMGAGRLHPNFPPANFLQSDPALMQQLGTMMWLKDLISNTNLSGKLGADSQKSPQQAGQKPKRESVSPVGRLPASSQLPSPCFQTRLIKDESSTSSDGSSLTKHPIKTKSPDLQSPNETFSTSASTHLSSLRGDDDAPIDVETTTDDDEHAESSGDDNSKVKPVIKLWRPYTPPSLANQQTTLEKRDLTL